ncbi:MAG: hypothetical protein ACKOET_17080, partial [Verrucomicrobiota bacterium]
PRNCLRVVHGVFSRLDAHRTAHRRSNLNVPGPPRQIPAPMPRRPALMDRLPRRLKRHLGALWGLAALGPAMADSTVVFNEIHYHPTDPGARSLPTRRP